MIIKVLISLSLYREDNHIGSRRAGKSQSALKFMEMCEMFLYVKGTLSCLTYFLASESPFNMKKSVFYVTLKALFVLKILNFLS